ncbi:hypothetical protein Murru_2626 [Allomuricauda ruestringensis DSM 13258]|uniref:Uncharacterized protein n=1 Tax=Allomuricauda ruestringensis (strain DSM 13258 / CIP 107369 / LMG 19739 / B1) TaxID=886377 RepID=G2PQM4_ALLRU|nr:hypothetical protein Murru_2626 [Allomuricauda ruestringensis DSM 13258]
MIHVLLHFCYAGSGNTITSMLINQNDLDRLFICPVQKPGGYIVFGIHEKLCFHFIEFLKYSSSTHLITPLIVHKTSLT